MDWLAQNLHLVVFLIVVVGLRYIHAATQMILDEPGMYEGMSIQDKFWFDRVRSWTTATMDYTIKNKGKFTLQEFQKYLYRSGKREVIDGISDSLVEKMCTDQGREGFNFGFNLKTPSGVKMDKGGFIFNHRF
jgi:hypothetical protein